MNPDNKSPANADEPEKSHGLLNLLKLLFLVGVLVAAWFVLDWLINK